jgi:hypothetical protein
MRCVHYVVCRYNMDKSILSQAMRIKNSIHVGSVHQSAAAAACCWWVHSIPKKKAFKKVARWSVERQDQLLRSPLGTVKAYKQDSVAFLGTQERIVASIHTYVTKGTCFKGK